MIKPEQIPDEVVEALIATLYGLPGLPYRSAIAAGLAAWPGAYRMLGWDEVVGAQRLELFLPLTEARDD